MWRNLAGYPQDMGLPGIGAGVMLCPMSVIRTATADDLPGLLVLYQHLSPGDAAPDPAQAEAIFARPRHPYTRLLAESAPVVGRPLSAPEGRETELPDPLDPPPGCAFAERCPLASDICRTQTPALEGDAAKVACHHPL